MKDSDQFNAKNLGPVFHEKLDSLKDKKGFPKKQAVKAAVNLLYDLAEKNPAEAALLVMNA